MHQLNREFWRPFMLKPPPPSPNHHSGRVGLPPPHPPSYLIELFRLGSTKTAVPSHVRHALSGSGCSSPLHQKLDKSEDSTSKHMKEQRRKHHQQRRGGGGGSPSLLFWRLHGGSFGGCVHLSPRNAPHPQAPVTMSCAWQYRTLKPA